MGRMRGCLWLAAGLVVAILAGAIAFITLQRATGIGPTEGVMGGPQQEVVVAASAIQARSVLTDDNVRVRRLPVNAVPDGAVRNLEEAFGKITLVDLYPGEVILAQRLVDPNVITGDGRHALVVADDQVLMALPTDNLMTWTGVLKPGDRVDLLFSLDFPVQADIEAVETAGGEELGVFAPFISTEEQNTFSLLQNATVAAIIGQPNERPTALLLTVSPQDALVIKYALDAGGIQTVVLRAPGVDEPFDVEPVDIDFMINRYRIPTRQGR